MIHAAGLSVTRNGHRLIDDISLSVDGRDVVGIVGPNGAGKSTLLCVLAGDVVPNRGSTQLAEQDVTNASLMTLAHLRSYVGPQTVSDIPFSVREVVTMGRHPFEPDAASQADEAAIVAYAMERTDIGHLSSREVRTLSSGEQQRVNLARALAQQAPIMLLDEPTSALDVGHQELVMSVLREVAGSGGAVVAALHDLNLAAAYADQILLLANGEVVAQGRAADVLTEGALSDVYQRPIRVIDHPFRDCPLVLTVD